MKMIKGITESEYHIINQILEKYTDYSFFFFGSRVTGAYEKTSDLDILIKGSEAMPPFILDELKEKFDLSSLPYPVNFSDYNKIDKEFYKLIKPDLVCL